MMRSDRQVFDILLSRLLIDDEMRRLLRRGEDSDDDEEDDGGGDVLATLPSHHTGFHPWKGFKAELDESRSGGRPQDHAQRPGEAAS